MRAIIWCILTALTGTMANAEAYRTQQANFMLPYCKLALNNQGAFANPANAFFSGICDGTIRSISIMLQFKHTDSPACVPDGVNLDQMTKVVVRYGELHPEKARMSFIAFVIDAILDTWPCQPSPRP